MTDVDQASPAAKKLAWAPPGMRWPALAAGWVGFATIFVWVLAPAAILLGVWDLVDVRRKGGKGAGRGAFALVVGVVVSLAGYMALDVAIQLSHNP